MLGMSRRQFRVRIFGLCVFSVTLGIGAAGIVTLWVTLHWSVYTLLWFATLASAAVALRTIEALLRSLPSMNEEPGHDPKRPNHHRPSDDCTGSMDRTQPEAEQDEYPANPSNEQRDLLFSHVRSISDTNGREG